MNGGLLATPDRIWFGLHLVQGTLFELDPSGRLLRMIEFGSGAEVTGVGGVARSRDGSLFVADPPGQRLRVFSPEGEELAGIGYDRTPYELSGLNVIDRPGVLEDPNDVALDADGSVYVACGEQYMRFGVQKFAANGQHLATFPSLGDPQGVFGGPRGLTMAPDGTLLVCDTLNHRLQCFHADGRFLGVLGDGGTLNRPVAVQPLPDGTLLVAENGRLTVLDGEGRRLREFAPRRVTSPVDLSVCGSDVWVLERDFGEFGVRLQRLDPSGALLAQPVARLEGLVTQVTRHLRRLLKEGAPPGPLYHKLGALHHYVLPNSFGAHRMADGCYRRALEALPDSFEVRFDLAELCQARNRRDEARRLYEECLDLRPDDDGARVRLALVLRQSGQRQQAEEVLLEGLRRRPESHLLREEFEGFQ